MGTLVLRNVRAGRAALFARDLSGGNFDGGDFADAADGFEADGDDAADEAGDVFGVVGAVGVADHAGALVGADLVLVDDPFGLTYSERCCLAESPAVAAQ